MRTLRQLGRWLAVAACIAGLAGAPSAAAQPSPVPQAWPPFPSAPQGFQIPVPANCLQSTSVATNVTPQIIPDLGVVTSTIQITPSVPYVWTVIAITSITHTASGDLNINLISPAGTVVTLAHHLGGTHQDVFTDTAWTDYAPLAATEADYSVPQMALIPEEAMGAFQGQNGTGTWSLVVSDDIPVDSGKLIGWEVAVVGLNEAPITTTAHFSEISGSSIPGPGSLDTQILVSTLEKSLIKAKLTTDISHPDPSQLTIQLSSPFPLTTTISHQEGFGHGDWFAGTQWYDKAGDTYPPGPVAMETSIYPTSPLTAAVPEGAMGHFLGLDPNGIWNLHIASAGGSGTLNSWALDVTTGHCLAHQYLPTIKR